MKTKLIITSIVLSFILSSCKVTTIVMGSKHPAKSKSDQMDAYYTKLPTRDYTEIAIIESEGAVNRKSTFNRIKRKARKLGADAIIVLGPANETVSQTKTKDKEKDKNAVTVETTTSYSNNESGCKVVAIKYLN